MYMYVRHTYYKITAISNAYIKIEMCIVEWYFKKKVKISGPIYEWWIMSFKTKTMPLITFKCQTYNLKTTVLACTK